MRNFLLFSSAILSLSACTASIPDRSASATRSFDYSMSSDYVSEYVFRGTTLAGEAIQPGVEVTTGNFTAGAWASVAIGEESPVFADELDLYAGYGFDVASKVTADVGGTYYHYPESGGLFDIGASQAGTLEAYGQLNFDTVLSPSVAAFYDVNLETFTVEGSFGTDFHITDRAAFGVSATAGLVEPENGGGYQYGTVSGELSYALSESAAIYSSGNVGLSSDATFVDTNFDPANLASVEAPEKSSAWVSLGLRSSF